MRKGDAFERVSFPHLALPKSFLDGSVQRAVATWSVTTLRDASRLAHLRFEGGVDTLLNALIVDTTLFDAELSLTETKLNELLSLVQLYKARWRLATVTSFARKVVDICSGHE